MEVDTLRDWIIIVYGAVGVVAICIVLAFVIMIYRKVSTIMDSAKQAVDNVKNTSDVISQSVIQPIARAQGFVAGLKKTFEVITSLNKKGEAQKNGE